MPKNIIHITDINDKNLDIFARLTEPQLVHFNEPGTGLFIAESPNVILRALDAGYEPVSLLLEEEHITKDGAPVIARLSEDIPIYTSTLDVLVKITGFQLTKGLLCAFRRKKIDCSYDFLKSFLQDANNIAVLEGVVNPTNIGAIIRSAAALSVDKILLSPDCADPLYRRSARVSMGTVFQIPWSYIGKSREDYDINAIDWLHSFGFTTISMALKNDSISISDNKLSSLNKKAIFLGTEGEGLSDNTIEKSDYKVIIPMSHNVDSLNVAAASAVTFWELCN